MIVVKLEHIAVCKGLFDPYIRIENGIGEGFDLALVLQSFQKLLKLSFLQQTHESPEQMVFPLSFVGCYW